jgi:hypothetical protein
MNSNWNNDDWGWYVDTEKNASNNFTVEYYHNLNPNKKMSYHLNRLGTIEEEEYPNYSSNYDYYEDYEDYDCYGTTIEKNNKTEKIENGYLFKATVTTIIITVFTYFTSLVFTFIS